MDIKKYKAIKNICSVTLLENADRQHPRWGELQEDKRKPGTMPAGFQFPSKLYYVLCELWSFCSDMGRQLKESYVINLKEFCQHRTHIRNPKENHLKNELSFIDALTIPVLFYYENDNEYFFRKAPPITIAGGGKKEGKINKLPEFITITFDKLIPRGLVDGGDYRKNDGRFIENPAALSQERTKVKHSNKKRSVNNEIVLGIDIEIIKAKAAKKYNKGRFRLDLFMITEKYAVKKKDKISNYRLLYEELRIKKDIGQIRFTDDEFTEAQWVEKYASIRKKKGVKNEIEITLIGDIEGGFLRDLGT